jgi:hypothetical protein
MGNSYTNITMRGPSDDEYVEQGDLPNAKKTNFRRV